MGSRLPRGRHSAQTLGPTTGKTAKGGRLHGLRSTGALEACSSYNKKRRGHAGFGPQDGARRRAGALSKVLPYQEVHHNLLDETSCKTTLQPTGRNLLHWLSGATKTVSTWSGNGVQLAS